MIAASAVAANVPAAGEPLADETESRSPWRLELARAVRDPAVLLERLALERERWLEPARRAAREFGLLVPEAYLRRMRRGDPADPLLRQVLPLAEELLPSPPGYVPDPLGETSLLDAEGALLAKYRARVLVVTTGLCAVHCRYCFRRHFPYAPRPQTPDARLLERLRAVPDLREVILSGGDPLTLATRRLREWSEALAVLPGLRVLRLHTRLPIVLPARVDAALLEWIGTLPWRSVVVVHANHPQEIDAETTGALAALAAAGARLLNQSVLLAGVNDDPNVLAELSWRLWDAGVQPYYLHRLDPVSGAAHFAVADERARAIVADLAARLPGYLVPRHVREESGAPAKIPVA
jgi:EF-P beta-lysylation protein EpmB